MVLGCLVSCFDVKFLIGSNYSTNNNKYYQNNIYFRSFVRRISVSVEEIILFLFLFVRLSEGFFFIRWVKLVEIRRRLTKKKSTTMMSFHRRAADVLKLRLTRETISF